MLKPSYTKQFDKDLKRMLRSGKNKDKIKTLIRRLINEEVLERKYHDHKLSGKYKGRRECHIEPDWLLIYIVDKKNEKILFERTGSHSALFD